jgi:hypothetical protein
MVAVTAQTTVGKLKRKKKTGQKEKMFTVTSTTALQNRLKNAETIQETKKKKTYHHAKVSILKSQEQEADLSIHAIEDAMETLEANDDWYADSDATRHMSGNEKLFSKLQKVTNSWTVKGVGEKRLYVKGIGDVCFKTYAGKKPFTGILKNVLYVPNLGVNLLSIGTATEKDSVQILFLENAILEKWKTIN